jgi:hypothetical protein
LRHLGGFIVVAQETINQVEYGLLVPSHQEFKGIGVTSLDTPDAFRVTYPLDKHRFN